MTKATILIADDDRSIRTVLTQALARFDYDVRATDKASVLWQWVEEGLGSLVITDVLMPDENGLDLVPRITKRRPELRVIVMSAQNTLLTALKATERGAFEYFPKPFDLNELIAAVRRALDQRHVDGVSSRERGVAPPGEEDQLPLIGRSAAMQEVYRVLARVARSELSVMITGESGTGKEIVARTLHAHGRRRQGPFVAVNMAAIPRDLVESELFGYEKGAYTGAVGRGTGRFEQAEGGTLFLDEIGDMPAEAQTRLLRVLQQGEYTTIGGRVPLRADVRIVAATHRDLRQLIRQGLFREDLFYRLNVVPLRLPPLRERVEDLPDLVRHFLAIARKEDLGDKTFDGGALDRLRQYQWPGNVRELENMVRRLCVLHSQDVIGKDVVEKEIAQVTQSMAMHQSNEPLGVAAERHLRQFFANHSHGLPGPGLYSRVLQEIERPLIALSLDATGGNQIRAAEMLGLNRNTLRKKIRELDIQFLRGIR